MAAFKDFYELTKPRLSLLSVFSAMIGFSLAPKAAVPDAAFAYSLLVATAIAFCAGGAAVLNQWMEYPLDQLMERTKKRPIPIGIVKPNEALYFGLFISVLGLSLLYYFCNKLSFGLALLTLFSYLLVYTPMKKVTPLNTLIGAFPGALPPLIGWSCAAGTLSLLAGILFAILFFWQMPHFYALAWLYRKDYQNAGFKMITSIDMNGEMIANRGLFYCVLLIIVSVLPFYFGFVTIIYLSLVILLNFYIGIKAYAFLNSENKNSNAMSLFKASIIYLPLLLILLLLDHYILEIISSVIS